MLVSRTCITGGRIITEKVKVPLIAELMAVGGGANAGVSAGC